MIKNIVFDIGGVLADFHVTDFLAAKGFDGPMIKRILKASIMTPYWGQFERGELTEEEALAGFAGTDPEITDELNQKGIDDIKKYEVDTVVMGGDWAGSDKFEYLKDYCELVFLPRTEGVSTTKIKKELKLQQPINGVDQIPNT